MQLDFFIRQVQCLAAAVAIKFVVALPDGLAILKYPPEGMDDAVQTVMTQCELWTDNNDMRNNVVSIQEHKAYAYEAKVTYSMVAEETAPYGKNMDN